MTTCRQTKYFTLFDERYVSALSQSVVFSASFSRYNWMSVSRKGLFRVTYVHEFDSSKLSWHVSQETRWSLFATSDCDITVRAMRALRKSVVSPYSSNCRILKVTAEMKALETRFHLMLP